MNILTQKLIFFLWQLAPSRWLAIEWPKLQNQRAQTSLVGRGKSCGNSLKTPQLLPNLGRCDDFFFFACWTVLVPFQLIYYKRQAAHAAGLEASGHSTEVFHFTGHMQCSAAWLASVFMPKASCMPGGSRTGLIVHPGPQENDYSAWPGEAGSPQYQLGSAWCECESERFVILELAAFVTCPQRLSGSPLPRSHMLRGESAMQLVWLP